MIEVNLTATILLALVGAALSALFVWFPKLNTWYAGLSKDAQSGIMLGLLILVAATIILLGCTGIILVAGLVCTAPGLANLAINLLIGVVTGMTTNQGTYGLIKHLAPRRVKEIKAGRTGSSGNPEAL